MLSERASELERLSVELQGAKEAADAASMAKGQFLANMSHEIRTPMNAILGLAYLLRNRPIGPAEHDMVQKIRNAGRSLLGIINDILDFSKIEAGRLEIEHAPFRLGDVLDNVATIMGSAVGEKAIELIVGPVPAGAMFLNGDALRLEQVLINLVSNAIKFTEAGEVALTVSVVDAQPGRAGPPLRDTRHRHRHPGRKAGGNLLRLFPGGSFNDAAIRWHRPRPHHNQAYRDAHGWQHRRRQRPRQRQRVQLCRTARHWTRKAADCRLRPWPYSGC